MDASLKHKQRGGDHSHMLKATVALNKHTRLLLIYLPAHKRIIHPNRLLIRLLLRNQQNGGIYWMPID